MKGDNIKAERDFLESGLRAMIDLRRIGSRIPLDEGASHGT